MPLDNVSAPLALAGPATIPKKEKALVTSAELLPGPLGAKDYLVFQSKHGVAKAEQDGVDRVSGTTEGRDRLFLDLKSGTLVTNGTVAEDPRTRRVLHETVTTEGTSKADLAEQIKRLDLFSRRSGARPYQIRRQSLGLPSTDQYDALFHEPKQDTQAILRIVRPVRRQARPADSLALAGFEVLCETSEFLLQSANEQDVEKAQIVETFDEARLYLMGRRARVFTYSGMLVNSSNLQWKNRFLRLYDQTLRGTRCVANQARAYLIYDDVMREGFVMSTAIGQNADQLNVVPFQFTMFITRAEFIGRSGDVRCPEEDRADSLFLELVDSQLTHIFQGDVNAEDRRGIREELFDDDGNLKAFAGVHVRFAPFS